MSGEWTKARLERFARELGCVLRPGDCVTLSGDMGAGKTTFAQALIGAIAVGNPEVTSPTFSLMQSYDVRTGTLWHLDLYRIEAADELVSLGLDEILAHITLIEWPEIARAELPSSLLNITLEHAPSPDTRILSVDAGEAWRARLDALEERV
jgi:tRNA threonylcarbamoyl adenosine modification protein YjeE